MYSNTNIVPSNLESFFSVSLPIKISKNINNVIAIPSGKKSIHGEISGYYSSIPATGFTKGKTVRDWLAEKNFKEQFFFGMDLLKQYGEVSQVNGRWVFFPYEDRTQ